MCAWLLQLCGLHSHLSQSYFSRVFRFFSTQFFMEKLFSTIVRSVFALQNCLENSNQIEFFWVIWLLLVQKNWVPNDFGSWAKFLTDKLWVATLMSRDFLISPQPRQIVPAKLPTSWQCKTFEKVFATFCRQENEKVSEFSLQKQIDSAVFSKSFVSHLIWTSLPRKCSLKW